MSVEFLEIRAVNAGFGRIVGDPDPVTLRDKDGILYFRHPGKQWLPVLSDPATKGVLLGHLRRMFPDGEGLRCTPISTDQWVTHGARHPDPNVDGLWCTGVTEEDSMVVALELIMGSTTPADPVIVFGRRAVAAGFLSPTDVWASGKPGQTERDGRGVLYLWTTSADDPGTWLPVFSDPASRGVLLEDIRELMGDPDVSIANQGDEEPLWTLVCWSKEEGTIFAMTPPITASSEMEALVEAYERAKTFEVQDGPMYQERVAVRDHIARGHTRHCACRIVWGDGECTCSKGKS